MNDELGSGCSMPILGGVGILFIIAISFIPFGDEYVIEPTPSCPTTKANSCLRKWLDCRVAGVGLSGGVSIVIKNRCFKQYSTTCKECDSPIILECRTYWGRVQKVGPFWLKFLPGGESYWEKYFGNDSDCNY